MCSVAIGAVSIHGSVGSRRHPMPGSEDATHDVRGHGRELSLRSGKCSHLVLVYCFC